MIRTITLFVLALVLLFGVFVSNRKPAPEAPVQHMHVISLCSFAAAPTEFTICTHLYSPICMESCGVDCMITVDRRGHPEQLIGPPESAKNPQAPTDNNWKILSGSNYR